jgi:flagellar basal-body rod modification protein FlgD
MSTTSATASAASLGTGATTAAGAQQRIAGDMRTFLQLLTTQLRNQDPTQPLDPNQFTAQLAQFASVEQQIAANQHMESLLDLQRSSAMMSAAPLVGRRVEVNSDRVALQAGTAQEVRLPALSGAESATRARIAITGANGTVVREAIVPLGTAASSWNWDGRDGRGRAMPDGSYGIAVTGLDAEGSTRGALAVTLAGTITEVSREGTEPRLTMGGLGVGLAALRRFQ